MPGAIRPAQDPSTSVIPFPHQWLVGVSSNPSDPDIVIDPYNNDVLTASQISTRKGIKMKKRYQWSLALAVIGGVLSTKTAAITSVAVLEGCAVGGTVGFILGWLLDRKNRPTSSRP
jgi:hypothetical protein